MFFTVSSECDQSSSTFRRSYWNCRGCGNCSRSRAINHQVLSANPTAREIRKSPESHQRCDQSSSTFSKSYQLLVRTSGHVTLVRSIIKYFQQVLLVRDKEEEMETKGVRSIIKYFQQVLLHICSPLDYLSPMCDQSSSTFSRSYTANGLYLNKEEKVRSIIKYFQQVLPLAGTRLL